MRLLLSLFMIAIGTSAFAQEKAIALGLGFSPTFNWMKASTDGMSSDGSRIGFSYGLIADINFGENYALGTGLYIANKGGKLTHRDVDEGVAGTFETTYKTQSIRIPITLKMRTKEIGYFKYYGQFGLATDFFFSTKADRSFEGDEVINNGGIGSEFGWFDLGLHLGIGTEYNISGTTNFLIGLSYENGFVNVLRGNVNQLDANGSEQHLDKKRATTNQIALNLGVLF